MVVPLKSGGSTIGAIVGNMDPAGMAMVRVLQPAGLEESGYAEVVDGNGVVVASSIRQHITEASDHASILVDLISRKQASSQTIPADEDGTPGPEVVAFAPLALETASWA